jgi:glutamate-1-semialdehyde 2,1-aminomutase
VDDRFLILGHPANLIYATLDGTGARSQAFRTLFLQETIRRGVLAPSFVVGTAHDDAAIDDTVNAVGEALHVYRRALEEGVERYLTGRPVKPVFRPYA